MPIALHASDRSASLQYRYELVARARKNRGYARAWGVDLQYSVFCPQEGVNEADAQHRDEKESSFIELVS